MSFKSSPITKNCTVLDVMGRRIVIEDGKRIKTQAAGISVTNFQPFQIYGNRVKPCRLTCDGVNFIMPLVSGQPMDSSTATLTGTGDVYLNARFNIIDNVFTDPLIWTLESAYIGFTMESSQMSYTEDIETGDLTLENGWFSWKIGSIGDSAVSNMAYYSGYEIFSDEDFIDGPIYEEGTFFTGEWGIARIDVYSIASTGFGDGDGEEAPQPLGSYPLFENDSPPGMWNAEALAGNSGGLLKAFAVRNFSI